jgi:hypothetical protein
MWHVRERREKFIRFGGKPRRKGPLVRPRRRWECGIRLGLREIGWGGFTWFRIGTSGEFLCTR